jgi:hypothetical protein
MKKFLIATFALSMLVSVARANDGHGGPAGPPPVFDGGRDGGEAIVGSDGSIYLTSTTVTSGAATTKVVAVRSTGTIAWTATLPSGSGPLLLSGSNLITETAARASDGTVTTTLNAISTASGSAAWTRALTGRVSLHPFSGGTYAIIEVPPATAGGTATRSLSGIGNDGSVLFTLTLP